MTNWSVLKTRLRHDTEALGYCADRMRLDSEIGAAFENFEIEMVEARRVIVRSRGGNHELVREEGRMWKRIPGKAAIRIGNSRLKIHWVFPMIFLCLAVLLGVYLWKESRPVLVLHNAGFEQADLSDSLEPFNSSVLDWEDFFHTDTVGTCNLERLTKGRIVARSGDNAVRLTGGGLMQRLRMSDGSPIRVERGLRIRVKSWVHLAEGVPFAEMRFALRVVDSTFPRMRQFEPAQDFARIDTGGWRQVTADLWITERDLRMAYSRASPPDAPNEPIALEGRSLALTIENRSGTEFYLDDISAQIVGSGGGEIKPFSFETPTHEEKVVFRRFDFWKVKSEGTGGEVFGVRAGETWLPPGRTQFAAPFHGEQVGFVNIKPGDSVVLDSVPVGRLEGGQAYELLVALRPDDTEEGVKIDYGVGLIAGGRELGKISEGTLDPTKAGEREVRFLLKKGEHGSDDDKDPFAIRLKFTARGEGEPSRAYFDNLRVLPVGGK